MSERTWSEFMAAEGAAGFQAATNGWQGPLHFGDSAAEFAALAHGAALLDASDRTQIEVLGEDRTSFLHNLSTNDIRKLSEGSGGEAFFTSVQGKILAFGEIYCETGRLWIDTVPGQAQRLLSHLEKYHIRERVEFVDRDDRGELLVAGPMARQLAESALGCPLPDRQLEHRTIEWQATALTIRAVDWLGPTGILLATQRSALPALWKTLVGHGATPAGALTADWFRIERGTPLYGVDIDDKNLAQEVDRDRRAISFVKGCYLGQETVARIDALGHVNQLLRRVKLSGDSVCRRGDSLIASADGMPAGRLTSVARWFDGSRQMALAYVRRERADAGDNLTCGDCIAEVLPRFDA